MSNITRLYGSIEVPCSEGYETALANNLQTIAELPEEGAWPWLVRDMFAVTPERVSYAGYLIYFAAAMKGVDEAWEQWLAKFESLLRKMYWLSVHLQLHTEYAGDHAYSWVAKLTQNFAPIKEWEFSGGPRSFDDIYKKKG